LSDKIPSALALALADVQERLAAENPGYAEDHRQLASRLRGEEHQPGTVPDETYIAIERAQVFGVQNDPSIAEGRLFRVLADGTLKPLNGDELRKLADDFPGFVRSWRLSPEE